MPSAAELAQFAVREIATRRGLEGVSLERQAEDPRHVEVGSSSTPVLPANLQRAGLSLINDSTQNIYLGLGQEATLHRDILIQPGGSWDGRIGQRLWLGEITAIAASAANLLIVEI